MRILWFSNTPGLSNAVASASGGWITALQTHLEERADVELGLVYYSKTYQANFQQGNTKYYPVQRLGTSKMKRLIHLITGRIESSENVNNFLKIVLEYKPDLIHIHGTENPFGLIIPHIPEIPVLISIQGSLSVVTRKFFANIATFRFTDWWAHYNFRWAKIYTQYIKMARLERQILKNCRFVAGRTEWDYRITRTLAPGSKYFEVNEQLRSSFYELEWKSLGRSPFKIFTTLGDIPYKGLNTIFETARQLDACGFEYIWHVAGIDESSSVLKLYKRRHEIQKLPVVLMGRLTATQLVDELMTSNCFVQTSYVENSSNSLAEAMLIGMPIIASAAGGTLSIINNGKEGVIVQDGDPYVLAGAIIECDENYSHYISMGEVAREKAHKRHLPANVMRELDEAYKCIVREASKIESHAI